MRTCNIECDASRSQSSSLTLHGAIALLGLFAGLCAIFAGVVSAAEGWSEYREQSWPQVTARIQQCTVDPYYPFRGDGPREVWYIDCRIAYVLGSEEIVTKLRSRSAPRGDQVGLMNEWVERNPAQSPIVVHYDPANHKKAVLTSTDMPLAGPRTPNNLRLLSIAVISCIVLLTIARLMRKQQGVAQA
jgi:hypothetical protein